MVKVVLFALVGLGTAIPSAHALDWKMNATHNTTVELSDNRRMLPQPLGASYNTINSLLFNAQALAPTSSFTFDGSLTYRTFDGPGEATILDSFNNSARATFVKSQPLTTYNAYVSRVETESSTLQLLETGQSTLTGTTIIQTAGAGLRHLLTPRDVLSWQTAFTQTDRTNSGGAATRITPGTTFTSLVSTIDLRHQVNAVTYWIPTVQLQRLDYGNDVQILFWRGTTGIQTQLTPNLSLKTSAGTVALSGNQQNATLTGLGAVGVPTFSSSGSGISWVADIALSYQYALGTVSLTAAHTTGPTTLGQFLTTDTVGVSVSRTLNHASSISTSASFTHTDSITTASDFMSATATYNYTLMRDLTAQMTYRYARRITDQTTATTAAATTAAAGNTAQSNTVLFVLRRFVTILP